VSAESRLDEAAQVVARSRRWAWAGTAMRLAGAAALLWWVTR
jgi:hypothetical protein